MKKIKTDYTINLSFTEKEIKKINQEIKNLQEANILKNILILDSENLRND